MSGIRIYVASLSDYNDGILHGAWIDATLDPEDINAEVKDMLERSPFAASEFAKRYGMVAEEWAIHDYEGFGTIRLSEWESFETVSELAQAIEEHGDAYLAYVGVLGSLDDATVEDFEDSFMGEYDSPEDYAYEYYEMTGQVRDDDDLHKYIDWSRVARDMDYSGYHFESAKDGGVYVFLPC